MEKKPEENKKQKRELQRWTPELEAVANGRGEDCRQESGGGSRPNERTAKLVPLDQIPEARKMLLSVLDASAAEVPRAVTAIRHGWPGRKPGEILDALRRLRDDRGKARGKHAECTQEVIARLKAAYAEGPAEIRNVRKELLTENLSWNRHILDHIIRKLGLTVRRPAAAAWPSDSHGYIMYWTGEKTVEKLARHVGRTLGAVRVRLSRNAASGRLRLQKGYSRRQAAALLGVSDAAVRAWEAQGLFGASKSREGRKFTRFSDATVKNFCQRHAGMLNRDRCSPQVLDWLGGTGSAKGYNRKRAHLSRSYNCPHCGRTIRGNGYYTHAKRCVNQSSGSNVYLSISAVQVSSGG